MKIFTISLYSKINLNAYKFHIACPYAACYNQIELINLIIFYSINIIIIDQKIIHYSFFGQGFTRASIYTRRAFKKMDILVGTLLVLYLFSLFSSKAPNGMKAMGALASAAVASFLVEAFHRYEGGFII